MIDSRAKGRTGELKCRDELRKLTGLLWERTPLSGALDAKHKLKGDLYVPSVNIKYCVEVKFYAEDHITTKLLTTKSVFYDWWEQTCREAKQIDREPLLIFKHNRSKWFAAFNNWDVAMSLHDTDSTFLQLNHLEEIYISLLTDFCNVEIFDE